VEPDLAAAKMRAGLCLAGLIVSLLTISLAAAEKSIDVSAIVPKTEAEKILGEPVRNPTPLNVNSKNGYYSKCNYYGTKSGHSLLLRVRQANEGSVDPLTEFDQIASSGGKMKVIDDLGDKAGMFNGAPENGLPPNVIMLYVVKGKSLITIGIAGISDEVGALEKAKQVAQKILAQL
jgi:hypothetical protein